MRYQPPSLALPLLSHCSQSRCRAMRPIRPRELPSSGWRPRRAAVPCGWRIRSQPMSGTGWVFPWLARARAPACLVRGSRRPSESDNGCGWPPRPYPTKGKHNSSVTHAYRPASITGMTGSAAPTAHRSATTSDIPSTDSKQGWIKHGEGPHS